MEDQEAIKQIIRQLALDVGFKLKEQANGEMDLNAYVYEFAVMLQTPLLESIRELQGQNCYMLSEVERVQAERDQLAEHNARAKELVCAALENKAGSALEALEALDELLNESPKEDKPAKEQMESAVSALMSAAEGHGIYDIQPDPSAYKPTEIDTHIKAEAVDKNAVRS